MSLREVIISTTRRVPAIPTAAARVSTLLQNRDVKISTLSRAIEHDPALAANVLRMANSVYFSGPRTVGSIKEAIMRLGTSRVSGLTLASAIAPLAGVAIKGYDLKPGDLWQHSVSAAVCVDQLIETLALEAPDYTFTAALLHDIGKIVLGTFVDVDAALIMDLAFKEGVSFEEAEMRVLGISHPEVGAILLESWNLPKFVVDAVRWHQQPDEYEGDTEQMIIDLVHAADALSMVGGIGTGSDGLNYRVSKLVAERLGLNNAIAETVVLKMISGLEEVKELFGEDWGR
ncbi:MAG TPA: HDOD domain-containing protein [Acidobacteriota bacterium]|nr:HDOD domain-containing protein [Acidobacteriota bacterium]